MSRSAAYKIRLWLECQEHVMYGAVAPTHTLAQHIGSAAPAYAWHRSAVMRPRKGHCTAVSQCCWSSCAEHICTEPKLLGALLPLAATCNTSCRSRTRTFSASFVTVTYHSPVVIRHVPAISKQLLHCHTTAAPTQPLSCIVH